MKNGLYERSEFKIAIYEREGRDYNAFVVITNDAIPNEPIVLTGDKALNLVQDLAKHISRDDENES